MEYALGIDLGDSAVSASVFRSGHCSVVPLGGSRAPWPATVGLSADGAVLAGPDAALLARDDASRVLERCTHRLGDAVPVLLGGHTLDIERLVAHLLRAVVDHVMADEGPPAAVALCHPVGWGTHRTHRLLEAYRTSGLDFEPIITPAPLAAIRRYQAVGAVASGQTIAVVDIGQRCLMASVLVADEIGATPTGRPVVEQDLGSQAFDDEMMRFTLAALGQGGGHADLKVVRTSCTAARRALEGSTDAVIDLGDGHRTIRVNRLEFEDGIRSLVLSMVDSVRATASQAGLAVDDLDGVILVGDGAHTPLVSQLVRRETGLAVLVDVDPRACVSLGGAELAAERRGLVQPASTAGAIAENDAEVPPPPAADAPFPPPLPAAEYRPPASDAPVPPQLA